MIDVRRFQNKYRTTSSRLKGYDYSKEGAYFVTICTKDKLHYFGEIIINTDNPLVNLSPIGLTAAQHWFKITEYYSFIILDQFIIMPNHLHGILIISNSLESNLINSERPGDPLSEYKNKFGPQRKNLSSIIRGYKSSVKSYALKNNIEFSWQPGYYDRVIRNHNELEKIQQYIFENPLKWALEKDNIENLYM